MVSYHSLTCGDKEVESIGAEGEVKGGKADIVITKFIQINSSSLE